MAIVEPCRRSAALPIGVGGSPESVVRAARYAPVPAEAQRNRHLLLGLMTAAGWDFYRNEWWHYQLFNARDYPLISNSELPKSMM